MEYGPLIADRLGTAASGMRRRFLCRPGVTYTERSKYMNIIDLQQYLSALPYPGRGILLGRSADDRHGVIAYFIMGRSANSRNRKTCIFSRNVL